MDTIKNYLLILLLVWLALPAQASADTSPLLLPPTSIALDDSSVVENAAIGTLVGILSTTDSDEGDSFVYELVDGEGSDDNRLFRIDGDFLLTDTIFNYEDDSVFTIQIASTDLQGEVYSTSFAIKIQDEAETISRAPTDITLSNSSVVENAEIGELVGTLSTDDAEDDGGFTYRLVEGDGDIDNASFRISDDQLLTEDVFDFEARSEYRIRISSTDSGDSTFAKAFTITIEDVAEANPLSPTNIVLSNSTIAENQPDSALIGILSAVSPNDGADFVYDLVAGDSATDNGLFIIEDNQLLAAGGFDFETQSTLLVRIQAADLEGNIYSKGLVITVEDVDETQNQAPVGITLSNSSIPEEQPISTLVGTFTTDDPDDSIRFTYTRVEGEGDDDNASFRISGDQLLSDEVFDFETKPSNQIRIRTTDQSGTSFEQMFTITVTDFDETVNQSPTEIRLSNTTIAEREAIGSFVGRLSTADLDHRAGFVYTLTEGEGDADNASFRIDSDRLVSASVFDFDSKSTYQVRITTTDPAGASFTQPFTIQVTEVIESENQPPTDLLLSGNTVAENSPIGTEVGYFLIIDPNTEDRHSVTLVDGEGDEGNSSFQIRDKALLTNESFDFETQKNYSIRVQAKDSAQGTVARIFNVNVTNINDTVNLRPTRIYLLDSVFVEGPRSSSLVSPILVDDPEPNDSHILTLVSGEGDEDNALFSIDGNQLLSDELFDYESQDSYRIRVRADDRRGGILETKFIIRIIEPLPNTPPKLANALPDITVVVDTPFTYIIPVGTFTDTEEQTLSYTLMLADSIPLPGWLTFDAGTLTLSGTPPGDTPDSLVIEVTASDSLGASASDQFIMTITKPETDPGTDPVTAVEDEVPAAWTVYPVPTAQREVTLRGPLPGTTVQLRLLDISGRLLSTYSVGETFLSEYTVILPTTLSTGAYFLEIETPKSVERKRIVLQ